MRLAKAKANPPTPTKPAKASNNKDFKNWPVEKVCAWMEKQGELAAYKDVIESNGLTGSDLLDLEREDYKTVLNIVNFKHRKVLYEALTPFRDEPTTGSATPSKEQEKAQADKENVAVEENNKDKMTPTKEKKKEVTPKPKIGNKLGSIKKTGDSTKKQSPKDSKDSSKGAKKSPLAKVSKEDKDKGDKKEKKKKKEKDENAPKRALSAYFIFSGEKREEIKKANPEAGITDIAKLISAEWNKLDEDQKKPFQQQADKEKARYETEMTEYKKNNPDAVVSSSKKKADKTPKKKEGKAKKEKREKTSSDSPVERRQSSGRKRKSPLAAQQDEGSASEMEEEDDAEEEVETGSKASHSAKKIKLEPIAMSNCEDTARDCIVNAVKSLKVFRVEDERTEPVSHLIVGRTTRTLRVLFALARGSWILHPSWAYASIEAAQWVDEVDHEAQMWPVRSIRLEKGPLLKGKSVFLTGNFTPDRDSIAELVVAAGGQISMSYKGADLCIAGPKANLPQADDDETQMDTGAPNPSVVNVNWLFDSLSRYDLCALDTYKFSEDEPMSQDY